MLLQMPKRIAAQVSCVGHINNLYEYLTLWIGDLLYIHVLATGVVGPIDGEDNSFGMWRYLCLFLWCFSMYVFVCVCVWKQVNDHVVFSNAMTECAFMD